MALYARECFNVVELRDGNDKVEFLLVRMRGKANKAGILVRVCYRPPNQDGEMEEAFNEQQLAEVMQFSSLVLMGDFSIPDIYWKDNAAQRKPSRSTTNISSSVCTQEILTRKFKKLCYKIKAGRRGLCFNFSTLFMA